jgi:GMP synthase-like glutamine amidotransferase
MDILVVQHIEADPIGILGRYLEVKGAWLHTWLVPQRSTPPQGHYDGLIVLGGPMNACEDEHFPHLAQVAALIGDFYSQGKPVLGICLGAQLIARTLGSTQTTGQNWALRRCFRSRGLTRRGCKTTRRECR